MSLFICGKCGKDFSDNPKRDEIMQKVRLAGYANILCFSCRCKLEDAVEDIAKRYLVGFDDGGGLMIDRTPASYLSPGR